MPDKKESPWAAIDDKVARSSGEHRAPSSNLLAAASGLQVTSGFSRGGHNSGSMHYQGSPDDPGAIDVDPRGMTPARIAQLQSQGFVVRDERQRPSGQAVWTGPHYHIQKPRNGQQAHPAKQSQQRQAAPVKSAPQDLLIPSIPQGATVVPVDGIDFNIPTPQQAAAANAARTKTLVPTVPSAGEPIASTDNGNAWGLIDNKVAQVAKAQAQPVAHPVPAKTPGILEGLGNLGQAGLQMLQQIPGAIGKEIQAYQQNPAVAQAEMLGSGLTGVLSTPTDLLNMATQTPAALGNAYMGRQVWKPALPEVYGVRDIPALKQMTERHPVADFVGGAIAPVDLGLGALSKAKGLGKVAKVGKLAEAIPEGLVNRSVFAEAQQLQNSADAITKKLGALETRLAKQEKVANARGTAPTPEFKTQADIIRNIAEPTKEAPLLAEQKIQARIQDAEAKLQSRALDQKGFRQLEKDKQTLDLLKSTRDEVTQAQQKATDIAQPQKRSELPEVQAAERNKPEGFSLETRLAIEKEMNRPVSKDMLKGLDKQFETNLNAVEREGNKLEPPKAEAPTPNTINPIDGKPYGLINKSAQNSADALKTVGQDVKTAESIYTDSLSDYRAKEKAALQAAGVTDVAEAQRVLGKRINELEPKVNSGLMGEAEALELRNARTALDDLLTARKNALDAQQLLEESKQPAKRQGLELNTKPVQEQPRYIEQRDMLAPEPKPSEPIGMQGFEKPAPRPVEAPTSDMLGSRPAETAKPTGNVHKLPEGGEVFTHGRDAADIQAQVAAHKGQIANIADIERHLQAHNPEAVPAMRNFIKSGSDSEATQFSYAAREAPGEPLRKRDNFVPTHFTFETIKPSTQRAFLRRKFGSDEAVISHLKQEIVNKGGSLDASLLQTKGGKDIAQATQIGKLITALNDQTGGAYLKSPRVHGINLGETTRSAAGDRGIRLDTISESSLTGRKVTPEQLQGHTYNNQIAPAMKALNDLAESHSSPVFKRAVKQIQKGEITGKTMRELKAELTNNKDLAAKFCNAFGMKP